MTAAERPSGEDIELALDLDWSAAASTPTLPANQFLIQAGAPGLDGHPEGVYVSVGHVAPPVIFGSPGAQQRAVDALNGVLPVNVHGKYFLTLDQLNQLISVLVGTAARITEGAEDDRTGNTG